LHDIDRETCFVAVGDCPSDVSPNLNLELSVKSMEIEGQDEQKPPIISGIKNIDPFLAAWKTWKNVVPMKRMAKITPATREG
jgi:hypothetical protein